MSTRDDGRLCVRAAETFLNCVIDQQDPARGLDDPVCRGHYVALKACCEKQGLIAIKLVTDTDSEVADTSNGTSDGRSDGTSDDAT